MNGHSCHHRKQNECGRNMPSFSRQPSPASLCWPALLRRQPARQPRSVVGMDHILSTEEERQRGKGSISRTVDLWVTKGLALLMSKELNYYTTHSSILAQNISRTEEPGEIQPMGSQRVGQKERLTHTQQGNASKINVKCCLENII